MNREIKFRGKRLEDGIWVHGDLLHICGGCIIYHGSQMESQLIEDRPNLAIELYMDEASPVVTNTVGQFTGLHDANGKEIYEGDIFQVKAYEPKFEVFFKNGVFEYRQIGIPNRPYPLRRINFDSYVLGNIYDNPELMEETK